MTVHPLPTTDLTYDDTEAALSAPPTAGTKSAARDSRFELLRLTAMLLIVAHHFCVHSGVDFASLKGLDTYGIVNVIFATFLASGGKVGVFLFAAITGYFLVQKNGHLSSLIRLFALTSSYSIAFYLWALYTHRTEPDLAQTLLVIIPELSTMYWFVTAYTLLYLLTPLINPALRLMSRRQFLIVLWIFAILWYVLPTLLCTAALHQPLFYETEFTTLFYAYLTGAFAARFKPELSTRFWAAVLILSLSATVLYLSASEFHALPRTEVYFIWYWGIAFNFLPVLTTALSIFALFTRLRIFHSPLINALGPLMLGVYLIHDNFFVRPLLWQELFPLREHLNELYFWAYALGSIAVVFVIATALEAVRAALVRPLNRLAAPLYQRADTAWSQLNELRLPPPHSNI